MVSVLFVLCFLERLSMSLSSFDRFRTNPGPDRDLYTSRHIRLESKNMDLPLLLTEKALKENILIRFCVNLFKLSS